MLQIYEIKLALHEALERIPEKIEKKLHLKPGDVLSWEIVQESVDARNKKEIKRVYNVLFRVRDEKRVLKRGRGSRVEIVSKEEMEFWNSVGIGRSLIADKSGTSRTSEIDAGEKRKDSSGDGVKVIEYGCGIERAGAEEKDRGRIGDAASRPVVVGFGPCGIFAALELARRGYRPVVIERGRPMEQRVADVERFWETGQLSLVSNVQFGEGGAGAFSDGKLNTGLKKDGRIRRVLAELVAAGAPREILYKQRPHIGTDLLRQVVVTLRKTIEDLGGEVYFEHQLTGLIFENDLPEAPDSPKGSTKRLTGIRINETEEVKTDVLILALGHSARDTFSMLYEKGLPMEQKPFSVGVRIEHPQKMIDESQYGSSQAAETLGAADYKLSYHCQSGRGVYTFCMCPGGYVVASASEAGGVVTNGMSYHKRDGENANSALLVGIEPEDFSTEHPLAGIAFQRKWENAAFRLGGGDYRAPAQRIGDFMRGIPSQALAGGEMRSQNPQPTYRPGVTWTDLSECLPDFVVDAMREALPVFGKRINGFDRDDGILTGVETRSSSPVRILRDKETMQSKVEGIFPAGEGAGYAGGIMSAAADGIKAAEAAIRMLQNLKQREFGK